MDPTKNYDALLFLFNAVSNLMHPFFKLFRHRLIAIWDVAVFSYHIAILYFRDHYCDDVLAD